MDPDKKPSETEEKKVKTQENKIRIWDASYELWKNHGNPLDDERFPKPLDHPTDDHPWNIDWKAYALKNGLKFKAEESEDDYGEEEE